MEAHFNFNLRTPNWYYILLICIHLLMRVVEVFFFFFSFPPLDLFPEPGGLLYLLQVDFSLDTPSSRKPFLPLPPPALARVHTHTHSFSIQESFLRPWEEPRNVFTWLCFFIKFSKVKYILYFFPLNNTLPTFQAVSSGPMKAVLPLPETHLVFNTELN